MTKLEKVEESAHTLVLADQTKRREEAAEVEKRCLELTIQAAERKAERDRKFMQQMMALMVGAQSYLPLSMFPIGYQPRPGYTPNGQPRPGYYPGTFMPANPAMDMPISTPATPSPSRNYSDPEDSAITRQVVCSYRL